MVTFPPLPQPKLVLERGRRGERDLGRGCAPALKIDFGSQYGEFGGPSRVTIIKVLSPRFEEMVHISEVNRATNVKSDAQVPMNRYSDPVQNVFFKGSWGGPLARCRLPVVGRSRLYGQTRDTVTCFLQDGLAPEVNSQSTSSNREDSAPTQIFPNVLNCTKRFELGRHF